jgi:hypothetical protein
MGRKSRMKKERRKAKENLNKHHRERTGSMKWMTKMTAEDGDWLVKNVFDRFAHIFKTQGEEGLGRYFMKYRSPVLARNSHGKVFEMGWVVKNGTLVLFADARMVPDRLGRFRCHDCGRGYFQCTCLEFEAMDPFPLIQQRRGVFEWFQKHKSPDGVCVVMDDDLTGLNFEEGSLRSSRSISIQAPNYEYSNHHNIGA